jgi:non-heme chloroperoxidase
MHGDDDQVVPIADPALSAKLVKKGTLKVYPALHQGICTTHSHVINPDVLTFMKQ